MKSIVIIALLVLCASAQWYKFWGNKETKNTTSRFGNAWPSNGGQFPSSQRTNFSRWNNSRNFSRWNAGNRFDEVEESQWQQQNGRWVNNRTNNTNTSRWNNSRPVVPVRPSVRPPVRPLNFSLQGWQARNNRTNNTNNRTSTKDSRSTWQKMKDFVWTPKPTPPRTGGWKPPRPVPQVLPRWNNNTNRTNNTNNSRWGNNTWNRRFDEIEESQWSQRNGQWVKNSTNSTNSTKNNNTKPNVKPVAPKPAPKPVAPKNATNKTNTTVKPVAPKPTPKPVAPKNNTKPAPKNTTSILDKVKNVFWNVTKPTPKPPVKPVPKPVAPKNTTNNTKANTTKPVAPKPTPKPVAPKPVPRPVWNTTNKPKNITTRPNVNVTRLGNNTVKPAPKPVVPKPSPKPAPQRNLTNNTKNNTRPVAPKPAPKPVAPKSNSTNKTNNTNSTRGNATRSSGTKLW